MNKIAAWFRKLTNSIPTATSHVTNEQILLLLDGEVADAERRSIERHLTDCWNCRFRCEEMQSTIHSMVECRNLVVDSRLSADPPSSRALLAARLQEQSEFFGTPSHPAMKWLAKYRQAVFAAVACCVILVATVSLWRKQPHPPAATGLASAQETLHQAISAERVENVPAGQVRHRSMLLRVRNVTKAIDITPRRVDVWDDAARHRSAIVDAPGVVVAGEQKPRWPGKQTGSLEARKVSHGGDEVLDEVLSRSVPTGFESLRVAEFSKLVTEPSQLSITRDKTMETLLYQSSKSQTLRRDQPRILLARLDLRSVDLHPMAEQLAIVDDSTTWEFRIAEEADVAVPLADVPSGVFDGSANAPSPVAIAETATGEASLDDAIDVLTVLDGAGALTQQDVQLQRSANGGLQVSGVVQDDVRRQALLQLLQSNVGHGLKVQIATVAEQSRQPRKARSVLVVDGDSESEAANAALTNYFTNTLHLSADQAERTRVAVENQMLDWSSDAESQAEALHEIFSLVPMTEVSSSSSQVRREWESLVQHHASVLARDLSQIRMTLRPLYANVNLSSCATKAPETLTDSTELLSSTRRISTSVSNFVAPTGDGTQSSLLNPSFSCLLASTEQLASRLVTPPPEP
jgi:hypothetical protein